ncbi:hypothetical protein DIPPA_30588 [Diplonema papillatum]|nr:hypothetical protein DIPPA_30588 [Diplonema papillatum]
MRLGARLLAWAVAGCCLLPAAVHADCPGCLTHCGYAFDGTESSISVFTSVLFMLEDNCAFQKKIYEKYPGLEIRRASLNDITMGASSALRFPMMIDALEAKNDALEVMELDNPWVVPFAQWLQPLPANVTTGIRDKFINKDTAGNALSIVRWPNQYQMHYRKDLFDKHNITLRHDTWEHWTEDVQLLQEKEQIARNDSEYRAFHFEATGSTTTQTNLLSAFLGGAGAGHMVEPDGTVSINNENTVRMFKLMVDWTKTIMHPLSWKQGTTSYSTLRGDKAAVMYMWTSWARRMAGWNRDSYRGYYIELLPTPGPIGGVAGSWQVAVSRHTKMMPLALEIAAEIGKTQRTWVTDPRNSKAQEPVHEDTRADPTLWQAYCDREGAICESMEKYPEFWDRRLTGRPAEGCGVVLDRCINVIAAAWTDVLTEVAAPSVVAARMESELNVVMGHWESLADDGGIEEWTGERIGLLVAVAVGGLLLVAVFGLMYSAIAGLRKAGATLPISAFLGLSALVLFCAIQIVAITQWNSALRDVSKDLGSRVQMESLTTAQLRVYVDAMKQVEDNVDASTTQIKSYLRADFVATVPSMNLDARSLLLLVDRSKLRVLASSDITKQEEKVYLTQPYGEDVSAWTKAALDILGDTFTSGLLKTAEIYDRTIDGKKVMINFQTAVAKANSRTLDFLLVYFVPEEVVYEEANRSLAKAINISVILSVVGVVVLVVLATFITLPLISLANSMEDVRAMHVEDIDLNRASRLTEIGSLILGFQAMCRMLIEYKSFMPKSLFNVVDDDTSDKQSETSKSKSQASRSGTEKKCSLSQSSASRSMAKRRQGPSLNQVGLGALAHNRASVLVVTLLEPGKEMESFEAILSTVEAAVGGGVLHSWSATRPDELVVSWGATNGLHRASGEKAANAALDIAQVYPTGVAITAVAGRVCAGNIGNKQTRGFAIFGSGIDGLHRTVDASVATSRILNRAIVLTNPEFAKLEGYSFEVIDYLSTGGKTRALHELTGKVVVEGQEWMYQLEDMQKQAPPPPYAAALTDMASKLPFVPAAVEALLAKAPEQTDEVLQQRLRKILDPAGMFSDYSTAFLLRRCGQPSPMVEK